MRDIYQDINYIYLLHYMLQLRLFSKSGRLWLLNWRGRLFKKILSPLQGYRTSEIVNFYWIYFPLNFYVYSPDIIAEY